MVGFVLTNPAKITIIFTACLLFVLLIRMQNARGSVAQSVEQTAHNR